MGVVAERNDRELLAAVADRDRGAFRDLHARHAPWITSRLRRRCADADIVAEAVQDTFVAAWRSASQLGRRGEPAAWLWGIAIRRLIGVLRSRRRWGPTARPVERGRCRDGRGRGAGAARGRARRPGRRAAAGSHRELRAVVQATVLDGLTTREAGRLLGIPAGHRQDPHDAGQGRAQGGTGMTPGMPQPQLLARFANEPELIDDATGVVARGPPARVRGVPGSAVAEAADPRAAPMLVGRHRRPVDRPRASIRRAGARLVLPRATSPGSSPPPPRCGCRGWPPSRR